MSISRLWSYVLQGRNGFKFARRLCDPTNGSITKLQYTTSTSQCVEVPLTRLHYPITRGSYAKLTDADLAKFRDILDETRVVTAPDELERNNVDWWRSCRGESGVMLKPRNTEEVSQILSHCNTGRLAVCTQAGNTAVVGSGVPVFDEIILSTQLMNQISHFDETSGALTCESGCVLESLDQYLAERGHMMPIDLGAKGSCQIGGNLATNAGGLRLFRYGNLHGRVLGLETVLASGEVIDVMSSMMKDNTGYDLKQLFIGSEGTLGVITRVVLHCPTRPNAVNLSFLGMNSFDEVLQVYMHAKTQLAEILSSCEFIDLESLQCAKQNLQAVVPLDGYQCNVLIETSGSNSEHDHEKLSGFLEDMLQRGLVQDGVMANSNRELQSMWQLRESLPDALMRDGHAWLYDISVPHQHFYSSVQHVKSLLEPLTDRVTRVCGYGHLGDGNVHVNVTSKQFDSAVQAAIEPALFEWTSRIGGSISAEHGIGVKKPLLLHLSKKPAAIDLMRLIKFTLDPHAILNPYKVLPPV